MDQEFLACARRYSLPLGDFPKVRPTLYDCVHTLEGRKTVALRAREKVRCVSIKTIRLVGTWHKNAWSVFDGELL